jgi:hypothetical protein
LRGQADRIGLCGAIVIDPVANHLGDKNTTQVH